MLSILIVNWNTRDLLRACLLSLRVTCDLSATEIIVVDNASSDDSAAMVRDEFPEVHLLAQNQNLGFAAGNNLAYAYAHAHGEWIWLLNPDTEALPGAAQALVRFLEAHPQAGAVASALIDARDGSVQRSCRTFPRPGALWAQALGLAQLFPRSKRYGFYKMGWWNYRDTRQIEQPMASSLLLRREAIERSGAFLFDEEFPIFFNDVELCWRLIRSEWEIWFLPESRVKHWGGAATGQVKPAMIAESHRSLHRFYVKHFKPETSPLVFWPTVWMSDLAGRARLVKAGITKRKSPPPTT